MTFGRVFKFKEVLVDIPDLSLGLRVVVGKVKVELSKPVGVLEGLLV